MRGDSYKDFLKAGAMLGPMRDNLMHHVDMAPAASMRCQQALDQIQSRPKTQPDSSVGQQPSNEAEGPMWQRASHPSHSQPHITT